MKFQSFNLLRKQLQNLAMVAPLAIAVTSVGCSISELYVPTANTPTLDAYGNLANAALAYDKNLSTGAVLTETAPSTYHGQSSVVFSGFENTVLTEPLNLYVNYTNMEGGTALDSGPGVLFEYSTNGGATWLPFAGQTNTFASPVNGTASVAIPAGVNLSQVQVQIICLVAGVSGGSAAVTVNEVWVQ